MTRTDEDLPGELRQAIDPAELARLEQQWGAQPQKLVRLAVGDPFLSGEHQRLLKDGRRAEICYIMHRGDLHQGVLLHIKTVYPAGAFRLPTGGIHVGEAVMETLSREIGEETGMEVGPLAHQVQVERMVGVVHYALAHRELNQTFDFATYCFVVRMPAGGVLAPQDPDEMIGGWEWVPSAQLGQVARKLEQVGHQVPDWSDWGHYRAAVHYFLAQCLAPNLPAPK